MVTRRNDLPAGICLELSSGDEACKTTYHLTGRRKARALKWECDVQRAIRGAAKEWGGRNRLAGYSSTETRVCELLTQV